MTLSPVLLAPPPLCGFEEGYSTQHAFNDLWYGDDETTIKIGDACVKEKSIERNPLEITFDKSLSFVERPAKTPRFCPYIPIYMDNGKMQRLMKAFVLSQF